MKGIAVPRHGLFFLATLIALLGSTPAANTLSAQDVTYTEATRSSATPYLRVGAGASVSETDINRFAVEPYAILGEIGYQFTPYLSLGAGYQFGEYPKFDPEPGRLHIIQGWFRYTVLAHRKFTHYLQVGGHMSTGGDTVGSGLGLAIGLDQMVSRRASIFVESNFNFIFSDDAVESITSGRARFSALGFLGIGTRIALRPAAIPPRIQTINGPALLERGESGTFGVVMNEDVTQPVKYEWDFGDGTEGRGASVDHSYLLEGEYTVRVTAENRGGRSTRELRLTVDDRPLAARIIDLSANPREIEVGEDVNFTAEVQGSSEISYQWNFGDGSRPVSSASRHDFAADRKVGALGLRPSESHIFLRPGTFEVTLQAENEHGGDERRLTVVVRENPCDAVDLEPVYFAFDRATLDEEARGALERNAETMASCPDRLIQIDGLADFVGGDAYNALLTMRRAATVQRYYREELGIDQERFIDRGLGRVTEQPCPDDARDLGCRIHRRVDTILHRNDRPALRPLRTSR